MIALLSNVGLPEMVVILVVALLVFGKRLPEVAVRAAAEFARARRSLTDAWRQSGIDDELRRVRRDLEVEQRRVTSALPDWRKANAELRELDRGVRQEANPSASAAPGAPADATNLAAAVPRNATPPAGASGAPPSAPAAVRDSASEESAPSEPAGESARASAPRSGEDAPPPTPAGA